jgi:hypothetical protein
MTNFDGLPVDEELLEYHATAKHISTLPSEKIYEK